MNRELLKKNFENHGFQVTFVRCAKEAAAYLKEHISGETVSFGGSMTLKEIDAYDTLTQNNTVIWHHVIPGRNTLDMAAKANIYLCSCNGISETGEIVNIDGNGNRLAMTLFGPKKVYYVVGKNKITPDLASAIYRAKNVAAPKNAQRFGLSTPCAKNGDKCYNCNNEKRICKCTLILDRAPNSTPSEIIFVDEELGY